MVWRAGIWVMGLPESARSATPGCGRRSRWSLAGERSPADRTRDSPATGRALAPRTAREVSARRRRTALVIAMVAVAGVAAAGLAGGDGGWMPTVLSLSSCWAP